MSMENLENMARERFDRLWENKGGKLLRSDIIPAAMENGEIHPIDYCISTIARLIHQPNGDEIIGRIRSVLSNLFEVADKQYIYRDESLHVSLLGAHKDKKRTYLMMHK